MVKISLCRRMLVHRSFGRSLNGLGLTLGHHIILNSSPLGQPEIGRAKLTTEHVSKQTSLNESNFPKKEQFPLWFFLNVCITTYVPLLFLLLNLTKLLYWGTIIISDFLHMPLTIMERFDSVLLIC